MELPHIPFFSPSISVIDFLVLDQSISLMQPAKKIYESLLGDGVNTTALAHIQVSSFSTAGEFLLYYSI